MGSHVEFKVANDGVKAKNKNQWGERITLKDSSFHGEMRWGFRSGNCSTELTVEAFDVGLDLTKKVIAGESIVD